MGKIKPKQMENIMMQHSPQACRRPQIKLSDGSVNIESAQSGLRLRAKHVRRNRMAMPSVERLCHGFAFISQQTLSVSGKFSEGARPRTARIHQAKIPADYPFLNRRHIFNDCRVFAWAYR
jgi:hypothetical protein